MRSSSRPSGRHRNFSLILLDRAAWVVAEMRLYEHTVRFYQVRRRIRGAGTS